jgi:uncharacterized protein DUF3226
LALILERDWSIVCEGYADKQFFRHLIERRGLPAFDIPFPQEGPDEQLEVLAGRQNFGKMLAALRSNFVLKGLPKGILLVADSSNDPTATFQELRGYIEEAQHYGVPDQPLQVARAAVLGGLPIAPDIIVLLIPWIDQPGSLESVCLIHLAVKHAAIATHVEAFCAATEMNEWPIEKRDKAKVQCFIAATNQDDPNKSLRYAFSGVEPIVSVSNGCFGQIAGVLQNFAEYLAGGAPSS